MKKILAVIFLSTACRAAAQPVAVSTAARPDEVQVSSVPVSSGAGQGRLILNISKNSSYSRVGLDYSVRWDFSDLLSFRPGLDSIASGVRAIYSWDITENTRVNYYGLRTNPWRMILAADNGRAGGQAAASGQAGGGKMLSSAAPHKRLRLSVSPLVDDLENSASDGLRDYLLKNSLKGVSPQWQKTSDRGKRAFLQDVLSLGIWDSSLPGVQQGRDGLEFISAKPGARQSDLK